MSIENGVLMLRGERKEEKEVKQAKVHRREVSYGSFVRSFTLPDDANGEKVEAKFKDGVLTIDVSKSEAKAIKGKQIEVR